MQKNLINYLILPKGIQSIIFKSYVYFIPFLYSLTIDSNYIRNFLLFIVIFSLFEFVINPSRYQLNDIADYKEDQQRHHHWQRPVNEANKSLILTVALSRFVLGTTIAFILNMKLGYLAILFIALQLFYDYFAKKLSALLSIFTVAIAYPLRSLTIFYGLSISLNKTVLLILFTLFFYSTYMVIQWRKYESLFIAKNKLLPKPHSEFFRSSKTNLLVHSVLIAFFIVFILLIITLMKIDTGKNIISGVSMFLIIILMLLNKEIISRIIAQFHNIFIAFLFIVFTLDKFLIGLATAVITIFIVFWYHKVYIDKFASRYFSEAHYEKT
ncbi:MAG: hypothetical protein KatS3mg096_536 [Candidatus Parcubacteria bacterium]|nr:MAG: hypothetical protein KatS3mg095_0920 [Candidatus Parcubacteria bacterium]GIW67668.1 MAG: hypothetical protein KatS3mg096_536 [Candidatus Parcubacteria bacterium]